MQYLQIPLTKEEIVAMNTLAERANLHRTSYCRGILFSHLREQFPELPEVVFPNHGGNYLYPRDALVVRGENTNLDGLSTKWAEIIQSIPDEGIPYAKVMETYRSGGGRIRSFIRDGRLAIKEPDAS